MLAKCEYMPVPCGPTCASMIGAAIEIFLPHSLVEMVQSYYCYSISDRELRIACNILYDGICTGALDVITSHFSDIYCIHVDEYRHPAMSGLFQQMIMVYGTNAGTQEVYAMRFLVVVSGDRKYTLIPDVASRDSHGHSMAVLNVWGIRRSRTIYFAGRMGELGKMIEEYRDYVDDRPLYISR